MTLDRYDWEGLRAMWVEHADRAVQAMATTRPEETFYVLVFMLEGLHGPTIAMNSLEAMKIGPEERAGGLEDAVWSPFEWADEQVDIDDPEGSNVRRYRALLDLAKDGPRQHRLAVEARHDEVIVAAAREVADRARSGAGAFASLKRADDFVVFVREHDVRRPFVMARRTLDEGALQRLFSAELEIDRQRAEIAARPEAERIRYLVSRLGVHGPPISSEEAGEQLAALGAPAVLPLMALLEDPTLGWVAAKHLATIGSPHADVAVDALIALARAERSPLPSRRWAAIALGRLGCFDALTALADDAARLPIVAAGLASGLPHTYPQLAALLDSGDPSAAAAVAKALTPGRARASRTETEPPGDIALSLAHARSPHAAIRMEVALAIGDPDLLAEDRPRAVAALVEMLGDSDAEVRRLAALGLERLRGDARHRRDHLEAGGLTTLAGRFTPPQRPLALRSVARLIEPYYVALAP